MGKRKSMSFKPHIPSTDSFYVLLAPPLFYRNFGVFPLHLIAHVVVSQRVSLKLFCREIIFEEFQPMCTRYWYLKCVTDRQTLH